MSAKIASRTLSSRSIIAPVRARVLMDIKHQAACGLQLHRRYLRRCAQKGPPAKARRARVFSALALRFQSLEQQREDRVDPRRRTGIAPFLGMAGMMEAAGGIENGARAHLDVGDIEHTLLHAIGQDLRDLIDKAVLMAV